MNYAIRQKVAGVAAAHGWKLVSLRKQRDGFYRIVLRWKPMYAPQRTDREVVLIAAPDRIYATVNAYVTQASGVYFMEQK